MDGETQLEMAWRHVREGARRVQRQAEIVAMLQEAGASTHLAMILLAVFKDHQRRREAHLARLEAGPPGIP